MVSLLPIIHPPNLEMRPRRIGTFFLLHEFPVDRLILHKVSLKDTLHSRLTLLLPQAITWIRIWATGWLHQAASGYACPRTYQRMSGYEWWPSSGLVVYKYVVEYALVPIFHEHCLLVVRCSTCSLQHTSASPSSWDPCMPSESKVP